ncbi:hypothetical protein LTR10_022992 [Elasticomyces elasticus]|uniref:Myb-like domain-containing protein n=1 Tax=Exophiala sideris TaxID=1016849 RepID=A0ABR0JLS4_9EURO|nr:hypothetical protein LTR10_022992 [Elasticomyces elasticus]KAK5036454.1 hypothetical protein LTS07_002181 [Exophiala sideris]KAK5041717.1 hypothetical protein LTR13_002384 [Exophiala sideris]KAK5066837.1 hypothetical protein LTR69_002185 [Exophiala sideris]KAK5184896.1 hypothetical protein LTR44_002742 [Eurotiomycetes sp. CCFEE 6388]
MSFFNANMSFFLDATASTPPIVEVVPLNDVEVFQYLDAHPDALVRYLTERVGLAESLIRTLAPSADLGEQAAPAKGSIATSVETEVADDESDSESVMFVSSGVLDEQAVVEDQEDDDDGEVDEYDDLPSDNEASEVECVSQAGPEDDCHQASNETPSPSLSSSPAVPSLTPPPSSPVEGGHSFLPFPAPPALVAASRTTQPRKKWRLFEEEACIRHMLDINNEGILKGEARFAEAQRRMLSVDGIQKSGKFAVKNFWNRTGRARSGFDERKNKKNPLATSKQGKAAKVDSRKNTTRKSKTASSTTKTNRKVKDESDSDEDDESYFSIESKDESPDQRTSKKRNRDDDSEDEWEPDQQTVNAVAKGLRTPKRARTAV